MLLVMSFFNKLQIWFKEIIYFIINNNFYITGKYIWFKVNKRELTQLKHLKKGIPHIKVAVQFVDANTDYFIAQI